MYMQHNRPQNPSDVYLILRNSTDLHVTHLQVQLTLTEYMQYHQTQNPIVPNDAQIDIYLNINTCHDDYNTQWIRMMTFPRQAIIHLSLEYECTYKFIFLCQISQVQHLEVKVLDNAQVNSIIECLHKTRNLFEIDIYSFYNVRRKDLIENLPQTLVTLTITTLVVFDDEVIALSGRLGSMHNISSLFLYTVSEISGAGIELLAQSLLPTHLHTLKLAVTKPDDIKPLMHLKSLTHFQVVLFSHEIDNSTVSTMATHVKKFTKLKTFEIKAFWSTTRPIHKINEIQQLSSVFTITQAQHIYLQTYPHSVNELLDIVDN